MGFSRTLNMWILVAMLPLLLTACPQPGGDDSAGGDTAATASSASAKPVVDDGLDFSFKTFDGVEHRLIDYRGKPVVANFFGVT